MDGDQHLKRLNIERPIFWNFEIPNIKITKDELFDFFYLFKLEIDGILIISQTVKF